MRLAGKVAIVTGAASGIGAACVTMFRAEGATVVGWDIDGDALLEKPMGDTWVGDLTSPDAVRDAVASLGSDHRQADILVNAAATAVFARIEEMTFEDWRLTLAAELDSVFLVTQALWPLLKASGFASVINFASANARQALAGSAALAHCAGKGGILAMTRQLAMEGAPHAIRANSISPGFIETAATRAHLVAEPALRDRIVAKNMVRRLGQPVDIAHCATWLASDESGYVTGADIPVDGGATAW